jgi:hypothetical protein
LNSDGRVDIIIFTDRIVIKNERKVITIEIKSGKNIDLFQFERYLFESDLLIVVRVLTKEVAVINK